MTDSIDEINETIRRIESDGHTPDYVTLDDDVIEALKSRATVSVSDRVDAAIGDDAIGSVNGLDVYSSSQNTIETRSNDTYWIGDDDE